MSEPRPLDDWKTQRIADGGSRSARGLLFQYLVTLDAIIEALERDDYGVEAHVERLADAHDTAESIDVAIKSHSRANPLRIAQIKSVTNPRTARPVGQGAILDVLFSLVRARDSDCYEYVTNAPLTSEAAELATRLEGGTATREMEERFGPLPEEYKTRLARSRITAMPDGLSVRRDLNNRILKLRRKARNGAGPDSSFLVCGYLLSQIHAAAAGERSSVISARDVSAWLGMDSSILTKALGRADWGLMVGVGWPELPAVARSKLLYAVENCLLVNGDATQLARVLVEGPSGIGKSSLVATYAFGSKDVYDFLVWVPCGSIGAAQAALRELILHVSPVLLECGPDETASRLRAYLQATEERWLIVLDDVVEPDGIPDWIPVSGNGTLIVTSRNGVQLREWPVVQVESTSREESMEILSAYVGNLELKSADALAAEELCRHLGDWPLALAMAGSFLAAAGGGLVDSTARYRSLLAEQVIHDQSALPRSVPIPLAQSILLSLEETEQLASKGWRTRGESLSARALRLACYLADAPIPVSLLAQAAMALQGYEEAPPGEEVDGIPDVAPGERELIFRGLVRGLRWRCLAGLASENRSNEPYVRVNSVVKQVVRGNLEELENDGVLSVLVPVLDWQIRTLLDLDHGDRAIHLADHARTLAHHALEANHKRPESLTLLGNSALAYRHDGQWEVAANCLRTELAHLEMWWEGEESPFPNLFAKTFTQLATVVFEGQLDVGNFNELISEAANWVLRVDPKLDEDSLDTATSCASTLVQLMDAHNGVVEEQGLRSIHQRLQSVTQGHEIPAKVRAMRAYSQAQQLVQQDRDVEAMTLLAENIAHCDTTESRAGYIGLMAEIRVLARDLKEARLLLAQLEPLQMGVATDRRALAAALAGSMFAGWGHAASNEWTTFLDYAVSQLEPLREDCRADQCRDLAIAQAWLARVAEDEEQQARAMADYDSASVDQRSSAHDVLVALLGLRRPFER
jgi:hypothetical protein